MYILLQTTMVNILIESRVQIRNKGDSPSTSVGYTSTVKVVISLLILIQDAGKWGDPQFVDYTCNSVYSIFSDFGYLPRILASGVTPVC